MATEEDKELREYRDLMKPPEEFADGFNWMAVVGAFFLGFLMMPGSIYLSLVIGTGGNMTQAARWVTIILFAEIARRSFKDLKMQEVYILYYMAGITLASPFHNMGGGAGGLLWNQYLVQSDYARALGIAEAIPTWVVPPADILAESGRTFFTKAWIAPIALTTFALLISKIDHYGLGYVLYRLTSDVEELPFPMAPVAASGITALANTRDDTQAWRWRCFSIGGMLGLIFGAVYIGVPAVTGAFLSKPVQLIPIPWVDFTTNLGEFCPATPINFTFDLGLILLGMVIPFWAVIGGALGVVITMIANPILYEQGILTGWQPQMDVVDTLFINNIDFYLSFSVGLTIAIAVVSMGSVFKPLLKLFTGSTQEMSDKESGVKRESAWKRLVTNNVERGDFSIYIGLVIYVVSSTLWIGLSTWLIQGFPWPYFVFYAAIYTPLISYATAKLEGLCGQAVTIPMVREATYILSGYKGVEIWFAPAPLHNYGIETVEFRVLELTGTKIMSQIKTQLVALPIIIISSLLFLQLLWGMAEVPSQQYPFAEKMWELQAKTTCLMFSATMEGGSQFMEAWKWDYFGWGVGLGTVAFLILSALGLPTLLVWGLVRGLGQGTPAGITFELIGALIGRYYFRKRFGDQWMKYTPVILAGYSCGVGLIAMISVAITILQKMMTPLLF